MTERPEPPLTRMSGVEYLRAVAAGELPAASMNRNFGYVLTQVEEGRVVFEGAPGAHHLNPMGTTHGGWFATILDSALGCAVMSKLPRGHAYTTLEFKVNLLRGIPAGTPMTATGTAQHVGRSTGVATAELRDADGRLYATASTTCLVMKLPGTPV